MSRTLAAAFVLLIATAISAEAQTLGSLDWVGTGDSYKITFKKTSGSEVTAYAGAAYEANAYLPGTAPWYLQSSNGFGPAVDILCIDFLHTARQDTHNAYFTNLAYDPLTRTRGNDLLKYQRVAWLSTEMETLPFDNLASRQERAEIHAAIWQLLSGQPQYAKASGSSSSTYSSSATRIAGWVDQSALEANYSSVNLSHFTVVTAECVYDQGHAGQGFNVSDNCGQEFLVRNGTGVVPEPGTVLLLATGLAGLVGMGLVGRGSIGV